MKKTVVVLLSLIVVFNCMSLSVGAAGGGVEVLIPDYQIIIDNSSIYYADSLYPFLNYKGVTYLPMTYEYARAMNLTTGWLEGTALMIAYNPSDEKLPLYETTNNTKYNIASIPSGYNIYVNGKKIDNSGQEYPLLNFRGVTYFPMTWEYAVDCFGWVISFENNTLTINTDDNTSKLWTLVEKRENDAVFSLTYNTDVFQEDGSINIEFVTEYYKIDYKTGEQSWLIGYYPPETDDVNTNSLDVTVTDGYVYCNGQKLEGIFINEAADNFQKTEDAEYVDYSVNAFVSQQYLPLEVIDVDVNVSNFGKNGNSWKRTNYTYIKSNEKIIPLEMYTTVENVYTLNDDIYFNTVNYAQTIFRHYMQNRKMWKLSADGVLTEIKYADFNSIKIIGKANNRLYLKCLWSPENPIESGAYSVSLVNDGYFTFDGEGIRFTSPYIYSDYDVVSDKGEILSVNNRLNKITACEIDGVYY